MRDWVCCWKCLEKTRIYSKPLDCSYCSRPYDLCRVGPVDIKVIQVDRGLSLHAVRRFKPPCSKVSQEVLQVRMLSSFSFPSAFSAVNEDWIIGFQTRREHLCSGVSVTDGVSSELIISQRNKCLVFNGKVWRSQKGKNNRRQYVKSVAGDNLNVWVRWNPLKKDLKQKS